MIRDILLPLLLVTSISLCAQGQDARVVTRIVTDTTPAWNTWKGEGCSMNYPGAWHAGPALGGDTVVVFGTVADGHSQIASLSVIIRDARGKESASKDLPKGAETIASKGPDASGAYNTEFTGTVNGMPLHGSQKVMVQGKKVYVLTFTTSPETYKDQLFLAEAMMNSFSLSKED